jgi:hypothetical protein
VIELDIFFEKDGSFRREHLSKCVTIAGYPLNEGENTRRFYPSSRVWATA